MDNLAFVPLLLSFAVPYNNAEPFRMFTLIPAGEGEGAERFWAHYGKRVSNENRYFCLRGEGDRFRIPPIYFPFQKSSKFP
jgi:hypothetical protein